MSARFVRRGIGSVVVGMVATTSAACSATHDPPPGALMLAIDTNLRVPDDIDAIGVSVTNSAGQASEDNTFALGPGNDARFPATLAVVRGTSDPITLRAVGYKNGQAFTVREATTTIPGNRTAVLHLDLTWLNDGTVSGAQTDTVRSLTTSCAAMNESPIGGVCQHFNLDSDTLPLFVATDLGSSADTTASVDIDDCFAQATTVTPSAACTLPQSLTAVNYAVHLPAANGVGWCSGAGCVVPLLNVDGDGWTLGGDGLVHLPPKICSDGDEVIVTPVTTSCPALSSMHPAHQDYGATTSDAGTDATMPPAADAGDAAVADASEAGSDAGDAAVDAGPAPYAQLQRATLYAVAADTTSLYLLETFPGAGYQVEVLPILFDAASTATGTYTLGTLDSYSGLESAAAFPYYALSQPNAPGRLFLLAGGRATGTAFGSAAISLNLTSNEGSTYLAYAEQQSPYGATQLTLSGGLTWTSSQIGTNATAIQSLGYPYYAICGVSGGNEYVDLDGNPQAFATDTSGFTQIAPLTGGDDALAYVDKTGYLAVSIQSYTAPQNVSIGAEPTRPSLAGSGQRFWWIDSKTAEVYGATWDGVTTPDPQPAAIGPDGATGGAGVQQLIVAGTQPLAQLVWLDSGFNLHRRTISTIP